MSLQSLILESLPMLEAVAVAAVVAAAVAFLLGAWPRSAPNSGRAAAGLALGVGGGFYAACYFQGLEFRFSLAESEDRLLLVLLPAVVLVEVVGGFVRRGRGLIWLLRLAIAGAVVPVLLDGSTYVADKEGMPREWPVVETRQIFAGLAGALAVGWICLVLLGQRSPGASAPLSLAAACFATAVAVAFSGYRTGNPIGVALAGSLTGAAVVLAILPRPPAANGAIGFGVVGLFGLLMVGHFFGTLTTINTALLFVAPLLCWLLEMPPRFRGFGRIAVALVPLMLVVLVARQKFDEESARTAGTSKSFSPGAVEINQQDYLDYGK